MFARRSVRLALIPTTLVTLAALAVPGATAKAPADVVGSYRSLSGDVELTASAAWFTVGVAAGATAERMATIEALADHALVLQEEASGLALFELPAPAKSGAALVAAMRALELEAVVDWAVTGAHTPDGKPVGLSNEVLLVLEPGATLSSLAHAVLYYQGARVTETWPGGARAEVDAPTRSKVLSVAAAVQGAPGVLDAHPNFVRLVERRKYLNDPYLNQQWYIFNIDADSAWDVTTGSSAVTVAVIDDGFDMGHEDLTAGSKVAPGAYDFAAGDNNPSAGAYDDHGTAVAGVAIAIGNNGKGVAGVCPDCRFLPIRQGYSDYSTVAMFDHTADMDAHVVNNSWGYAYPSWSVINAIQDCITSGRDGLGTMVVFASGNEGQNIDQVNDISAIDGVVAVAASNQYDSKSGYSNWGPSIGVCAPADGQVTTDKTNGGYSSGAYTGSFGGTSGASPVVAGAAGLIFSVEPGMTELQARNLLYGTADKTGGGYGSNGKSNSCGYGRINAYSAVLAAGGVEPAPPTDDPGPPDDPTPPTGTGDGTCGDFVACIQDCEVQACVDQCGANTTDGGLQLAVAMYDCLEVSGCFDAQTQDQFDSCAAGYCGGQIDACFADGGDTTPPPTDDPSDPGDPTVGTGGCGDLVACVNVCQTQECVDADEAAVGFAVAMYDCLEISGCYDTQTQEQFESCALSACVSEIDACFADVGGQDTGGVQDPPVDGGNDDPPADDPPADDPPADDPPDDDPTSDPPVGDPVTDPPTDDPAGGEGDEPAGDGGDADPSDDLGGDPSGEPVDGDPDASGDGGVANPDAGGAGGDDGASFQPGTVDDQPTTNDNPPDSGGCNSAAGGGGPAGPIALVLGLLAWVTLRRRATPGPRAG